MAPGLVLQLSCSLPASRPVTLRSTCEQLGAGVWRVEFLVIVHLGMSVRGSRVLGFSFCCDADDLTGCRCAGSAAQRPYCTVHTVQSRSSLCQKAPGALIRPRQRNGLSTTWQLELLKQRGD